MAGGGGGSDGDYGLQIAPMLDVMFVLMLFFMVMAGTQTQEAEMGIDLPSTGAPQNVGKPPSPVYIKIDPTGQVFFNDFPVDTAKSQDLRGLKDRLKKAINQFGDKTPVIIVPNDVVKHQRIVDVMNSCVQANVKNLSFGST